MTEAAFFVSGFLACLALCRKRLRESRRAFNAACELLGVAHQKIARLQGTLSNIRGLLHRSKSNLDLGGRAMLPAAAEPTRQRFSLQILREFEGLPPEPRSRFSGR